ncbi:hypothetical protein LEMLEM_LOCUS5477 [Lemmus lemmus]
MTLAQKSKGANFTGHVDKLAGFFPSFVMGEGAGSGTQGTILAQALPLNYIPQPNSFVHSTRKVWSFPVNMLMNSWHPYLNLTWL